jgi:hypothetical protein
MIQSDPTNHHFQMAVQYVNNTAQNIFLTGKAGTGKTTFLKYIKANSYKKLSVVAPTGVAAINAGGVTIHSFFQLPFGLFLPTKQNTREYSVQGIKNQQSLFEQMHLTANKRTMMQELELLIIDEVSMVRADLIDAMDCILRHVRRQPDLPFGGVQILFIGDLFQLPPVVSDHEWKTLSGFYESPFFFDAHALRDKPPVYLELKKMYRQSDASFINLLNNIRNSKVSKEDVDLLHQYYKPGFQPETSGEYITLTSHNAKADTINRNELLKIKGAAIPFKATVKGEFSEKALPAENTLLLKPGAQVIFIKNDKGEDRRYYNGKIGIIKRIQGEEIYVGFPNSTDELLVEKEVWRNVRYKFNNDTDKIEEEELGTFTQYPLRLAWAITIHKSQGLTFNKAIIDAGDSFAPGQVYVALSRLTSLEGLVLYSRIDTSCISTDDRMVSFSETEQEEEELKVQLEAKQKEFMIRSLLRPFDWGQLIDASEMFFLDFEYRKIPLQNEAALLCDAILKKTIQQQTVAAKFVSTLEKLLPLAEQDGYKQLHERVESAFFYFADLLTKEQIMPLEDHYLYMKNRAKVKTYIKELLLFLGFFKRKKAQIEQAAHLTKGLMEGVDMKVMLEKIEADKKNIQTQKIQEQIPKGKREKGESNKISLSLFQLGKSVKEIAEEREMAISTIEGHLISFIPTGEVDIDMFLSKSKIEIIRKVMDELGEVSSSIIKEKLGEGFSYVEIKAVQNHLKVKVKF